MKTICVCSERHYRDDAASPWMGAESHASQEAKVSQTRVLASVGDSLITLADVDLELGRNGQVVAVLAAVPEPVL